MRRNVDGTSAHQSPMQKSILAALCVALFTATAAGCHKTAEPDAMTSLQASAAEADTMEACERLDDAGLRVTMHQSSDASFTLTLHTGAMDEDAAATLRVVAAEIVARHQAVEDELSSLQVAHVDGERRDVVAFSGVSEVALDTVFRMMSARIARNPQASGRVEVVRTEEGVEMRLPAGGGFIRSRTRDAARDVVETWQERIPTTITLSEEPGAVEVVVTLPGADDDEARYADALQHIEAELQRCEPPAVEETPVSSIAAR